MTDALINDTGINIIFLCGYNKIAVWKNVLHVPREGEQVFLSLLNDEDYNKKLMNFADPKKSKIGNNTIYSIPKCGYIVEDVIYMNKNNIIITVKEHYYTDWQVEQYIKNIKEFIQ